MTKPQYFLSTKAQKGMTSSFIARVRRVAASGMTSALVSALGLVRVSNLKVLKDEFAQQAQRWRENQCLRVIWSQK
jgi:hypothetical protein